MFDYGKLVEKISYIARVAGLEILKIYNRKIQLNVNKKLDNSPVTNADLCANRIIIRALRSWTPKIPILSEETLPQWQRCRDWNYFWVVDPLDGTREFLSHNGEFTINIAFVEYGKPVMGVIYVPVYNLLYASDNGTVWKIDSTGRRFNITVSKMSSFPIVLMSRNYVDYNFVKMGKFLMNINNYKIVNVGSSFKFCLIAEGSAQLYPRFSYTKIWDTAAGHAIAVAAGAIINDWHGSPLDYRHINKCFFNPGFQVFSYIQ